MTTGPSERASCSRWVHPLRPAEPGLHLAGVAAGHTEPDQAGERLDDARALGVGERVHRRRVASVMVMSVERTVTRSSMSCTR